MGFWVFMLAIDALIPLSMIACGVWFLKSGGPENINRLVGYRTSMSMKNTDTWKFAHTYCGKLWRNAGLVLLLLSIGSLFFVMGREVDVVGLFGGALCGVQLVVMIVPIGLTERALKKRFDKDGNPR